MGWWRFIKFSRQLIKQIGADDLSGAAAEIAYKFFLALFPFLIFLVAAGGFVADLLDIENPADQLIEEVGPSLPADVETLVYEQVDAVTRQKSATLLSIGILGAIWAASSGIGTVIKALNKVFDVKEDRSLPRRYGVAVGLTVIAGLFVMASAVIVVAGQASGREIVEQAGLEGAWVSIVLVARFAIICLLLLSAVAFVFWAAPAADVPFRWLSHGAAVFVVLWLASTSLFSLYVTNLGSYNATYGALGSVVVLLVWIYLSSFLFLAGAEVNAILARSQVPLEPSDGEGARVPGIFGRLKRAVSASLGALGRVGGAVARIRPGATRPS